MKKTEKTKDKNQNYVPYIIVGALVVLAIGAYTTGIFSLPSRNASDIVATVNGDEITKRELDSRMNATGATEEQRENILNQLIGEQLIRQEAKRRGVVAEESEINNTLSSVVASLGSREAFEEALVEEGVTEEELRDSLAGQILFEGYVDFITNDREVEATEDEILALYNEVAADQEVPPLEEVRDQVSQEIVQQELEDILSKIIEELRAEAEIEIFI